MLLLNELAVTVTPDVFFAGPTELFDKFTVHVSLPTSPVALQVVLCTEPS